MESNNVSKIWAGPAESQVSFKDLSKLFRWKRVGRLVPDA